ncbi:MAG: hypothetical protein L6Q37_07995 [Bdellovibrionaceae bacterium]|nr:hypothetical protein [Pseudobdellovibrionaceae bacterium]NUM59899.1 hypothetical protein [Pseudobdellovibrionaceae bacterium]
MKKLNFVVIGLLLSAYSVSHAALNCMATVSILGVRFYSPVAVLVSENVTSVKNENGFLQMSFDEKKLEKKPAFVNLDTRNIKVDSTNKSILPFQYQLIVSKYRGSALTVLLEPLPRESQLYNVSLPLGFENGTELTKVIANPRNPAQNFILKCNYNKPVITGY